VGVSEGRAVLDGVRAARLVKGAGAGPRYAVWGHSQGGQAALFAGALAAQYAPELALVGVATAAPATELATLFGDDIGTPLGRVLTAYTFWSWSRVYDDSLRAIVAPGAEAAMNAVAADCAESMIQGLELSYDQRPLAQSFLTGNPTQVEPWRGIIARNTPGDDVGDAPLFIAQGTADPLVLPTVTESFARALCRRNAKVRLLAMPGVTHNPAGKAAAPAAAQWIANRFANEAAPDDCATLR
jgi:pimeloyl-ACP methyl ester carboxylesterase